MLANCRERQRMWATKLGPSIRPRARSTLRRRKASMYTIKLALGLQSHTLDCPLDLGDSFTRRPHTRPPRAARPLPSARDRARLAVVKQRSRPGWWPSYLGTLHDGILQRHRWRRCHRRWRPVRVSVVHEKAVVLLRSRRYRLRMVMRSSERRRQAAVVAFAADRPCLTGGWWRAVVVGLRRRIVR